MNLKNSFVFLTTSNSSSEAGVVSNAQTMLGAKCAKKLEQGTAMSYSSSENRPRITKIKLKP